MLSTFTLETAQASDEAAIVQLLQRCELPFEDLTASHFSHFLVARQEDVVIGVVGLELAGEAALLRSLAVAPAAREQGLATQLVQAIERHTQQHHIQQLYMLTITADRFFAKQGYDQIERSAAPDQIQATSEFSTICPDSAICMVKRLS